MGKMSRHTGNRYRSIFSLRLGSVSGHDALNILGSVQFISEVLRVLGLSQNNTEIFFSSLRQSKKFSSSEQFCEIQLSAIQQFYFH